METTTTIFAELLSFPDGASDAVAVIRNYGEEPFIIEAAGSSAPFFVVAAEPPFGTPVPAGGSIRVTVRFAPDEPGSYARLLSIGGTVLLCEASTELGENDREWITSMPPRVRRVAAARPGAQCLAASIAGWRR